MKVKELVDILSKCDPNVRVCIQDDTTEAGQYKDIQHAKQREIGLLPLYPVMGAHTAVVIEMDG